MDGQMKTQSKFILAIYWQGAYQIKTAPVDNLPEARAVVREDMKTHGPRAVSHTYELFRRGSLAPVGEPFTLAPRFNKSAG